MLHSTETAAGSTIYAEGNRFEFDDVYEEIEDYADGKGSCLASLSIALIVATVTLGFAAIMITR